MNEAAVHKLGGGPVLMSGLKGENRTSGAKRQGYVG